MSSQIQIRSQTGISLIEVLISMVCGLVLIQAILFLFQSSLQTHSLLVARKNVSLKASKAFWQIGKDIHQGGLKYGSMGWQSAGGVVLEGSDQHLTIFNIPLQWRTREETHTVVYRLKRGGLVRTGYAQRGHAGARAGPFVSGVEDIWIRYSADAIHFEESEDIADFERVQCVQVGLLLKAPIYQAKHQTIDWRLQVLAQHDRMHRAVFERYFCVKNGRR